MVQPTRLNRWALAATARTEVDVNALKLRRQPLKEIELPTPEPTGTEILLEVTHCGVCHSDLHIRQGYYDVGGGQTMPLTDHGVVLPLAIGLVAFRRCSGGPAFGCLPETSAVFSEAPR